MATTVIVHFINDDPIVAEMEELPEPTATLIKVSNLRRRDGKPVHYITAGSVEFIFSLHRISFIEIMADHEESEVIEFFRQ